MTRKEQFEQEYNEKAPLKVLVVAVELPSGAVETIVNYQDIQDKFEYYKKAYGNDLHLNNQHYIRIAGWLMV